jgi:hypothetical protein
MTTTNTTPTGTEAGIDLDKLEALLSATTPGEWLLVDRTVYSLEHDGWRKGVEQFRNRFSCSISRDGSGAPEDELVANAEFIVAAKHAMPALIALARRAAPLAHPIGQVKQERAQLSGALEAIAQSWDECICDGIGEDREIGTVLREQFARVVAPSSTDSAQAAVEEVRNQALEEAARACVAERVVNTGDDTDTAYNMATSHCAKAIRALKSTAAQAATQGDKS